MQTFTTARGECPEKFPHCSDYCESIQVCAELERGVCEVDYGGLIGLVQRNIYNYRLKIQNCSQNDIFIDTPVLNFLNHVILVNTSANPNTESIMGASQATTNNSVTDPTTGIWKTLTLTSNCGNVNFVGNGDPIDSYAGGFGITNPVGSARLLENNNNILPPGECCFSLTFAIDVKIGTTGIPLRSVYIEPVPLTVSGRSFVGGACCRFERSLLVPGDCKLQLRRGVTPVHP